MAHKSHTIAFTLACLLLAGCTTLSPANRVTLNKGQTVAYYQLLNVDAHGRAEFRCGANPRSPHVFASPGESFGCTVQAKDKSVTHYNYRVQSTDPNTQKATLLSEVTTD